MEVDVGDDRNLRHSLPDLFQCHCSVVIWNGKPDDLATRADHLLDLRNGSAHVRSVSLGHRLNRNGSATTDLNMLNLNWSRFAHELFRGRRGSRRLFLLAIASKRLQQVVADNKNHQQQHHHKTHLLNTVAHRGRDRQADESQQSFDQHEEDCAAIEHGNWQQVEDTEIQAEKTEHAENAIPAEFLNRFLSSLINADWT